MSILVVDDSEVIRELFATMLRLAGYADVILAKSVNEAFQLMGIDGGERDDAASGDVELVLMDIVMPGIDGIEACRRIRAHARSQHIPVIMVTGKEDMGHLQAAFDAGASDYITKPVKKEELLLRVRSALQMKRG